MNKIQSLRTYGQSIWLDFISRSLLESGELKGLIDQGISGVTSNPSIFQKSIGETHDYDSALAAILQSHPQADLMEIYEQLAVEDIRRACDLLKPVYDSNGGADNHDVFSFLDVLVPGILQSVAVGRGAEVVPAQAVIQG